LTKAGDKPNAAFRKGKKDKGGRPLTLTDELIKTICENLKHGAYIETAVACAGVPKATFYLWCKIAHKKPRGLHMKLIDAIEKAQSESESRDLMNISKHAAKSWQAAAWRLSRKNPSRWAATHRPPVPSDAPADNSSFVLSYNLDVDEEILTEKDE